MSERNLFGTDGIRGQANIYPMTCEVAMNLGRAVTHYFKNYDNSKRPLIIIGKDTRRSCYMLEQAFSSGVCSQGGKVVLTGPVPTPGVAFITKSMRADAGVMISASHNKYSDNGIKLFDRDGNKLSDEIEEELEKMILNPSLIPIVVDHELGKATRLDEALGRYVVLVKSTFSSEYDLDGMRMVLDCANGAGYKVAPMVFEELGAELFVLGNNPNGVNINDYCGSMYPQGCQEELLKYRAEIGVCLDGDADRVVIIDDNGVIVDGDHLIGMFAKLLLDRGEIKKGDTVVGTVMSNLGLEHFVKSLGLKFHRTKVGDRYIIEYMKKSGAFLGGEPSGHIIFKKHSTTGDGILATLKAIECTRFYNRPLSELSNLFTLYPQILKNIEVDDKPLLEDVPAIQKMIAKAELVMKDKGRVVLRYSGTENLIRLMIEGEDMDMISKLSNDIVDVIKLELNK